jgi:hypothetical protein
MRSISDRDVLIFANESRDPSQSLYFFTVHRQKLIPIKNKWKWTVWNDRKDVNGLSWKWVDDDMRARPSQWEGGQPRTPYHQVPNQVKALHATIAHA